MKKQSRTGRVVKRIINVRSWFDWDRTKESTLYLTRGMKRFFVPNSASVTNSFDEVKTELHLTEADLLQRQKSLLRLSILMLITAFFIFLYAMYLLFSGHLAAFFLSFIVMSIALVLAFRYHYWHFLIKKKKLQCSVKEWLKQGLLSEK